MGWWSSVGPREGFPWAVSIPRIDWGSTRDSCSKRDTEGGTQMIYRQYLSLQPCADRIGLTRKTQGLGDGERQGSRAKVSSCIMAFVTVGYLHKRRLRPVASIATRPEAAGEVTAWGDEAIPRRDWLFRGHKIAYRCVGEDRKESPAIVCVHGFGAHSYHWRKNMPVLGEKYRVFAIDLLGFGFSDKPLPGSPDAEGRNTEYTYEYWSAQLGNFIQEVIGGPAFLAANSIGCVVAMQAAVNEPKNVRGIVQFDTSLRQLTVQKRDWINNITAPFIMRILLKTCFLWLSKPQNLKNVLGLAYHKKQKIDDDLVEALRAPAMLPNALDVFLAFITYDTGPVPEDLLPLLTVPTMIIWGEKDRLEPLALGRPLGCYPVVEHFVVLPGVGHCPQDEEDEVSNKIIAEFVERHRDRA